MFVDLKRQYRNSLKSYDTEENIDLAFYRPLGFAWAYLFRRLGVTPNVVTVASIFLGVAAGVLFYFPDHGLTLLGILLLVWANTFDSCDGQLARLTGNYSKTGRILDGLSGDLWFITIYVAICLRENKLNPFFSEHTWVIWLLAVGAGICHAKQAAVADYYRQFHLFFVKGEGGSELDRAADLRTQLRTLSWRHDFRKKIVLYFYKNYTDNQELLTPGMQRLRTLMADRWPHGHLPAAFVRDFRAASRPLMKYTNFLTFNWRSITIFITLLAGCPWMYFVLELTVFNAVMAYLMWRHEEICRSFATAIREGEYA